MNLLASKYFKRQDYKMAYLISDAYAKMEYGYCITSHKSQGSTYRNVYVLKDNIINGYSNYKIANQSLYVACSRASDKLVILSDEYKSNPDLVNGKFTQNTHLV
jgi:ATP-dependent exoDNAse (exonuclease V) alpha subunit